MKLSLKTSPYYFGVYANMARHNAYKILTDIAERIKTNKPNSEEKLFDTYVIQLLNPGSEHSKKYKGNLPDTQRKIIEQLNRHFIFLRALNRTIDAANPDPAHYYQAMHEFLECLDNMRHQYTHAIHIAHPVNKPLIKKLEWIFDDGLKEVKQRFDFSKEAYTSLNRYDGLEKKKAKPNPKFDFGFLDSSSTITEKGIAFFICLFLEKEYATLFLKKLKGFDKADSDAERAILETYTVYGSRQPHTKLHSMGNSHEALVLDMLNELQRCPKELYETLSEEDKNKFVTKILSSLEEDMDTGDENKTIMLRKQNRFPYFALRYIDNMELFKNLRFHVDLGNYHFKSYGKKMDSMSITRRWEKKILSFGRLQDFAEIPDNWDIVKDPAEIDIDTPAPFLVQTNPHYNFVGNNIGLKNIKIRKGGKEFPLWPERVDDVKPPTSEPDYFLATDELTGLLFYDFLARQYNAPLAEEIITGFGAKSAAFLKAVANKEIKPIARKAITNENSSAFLARLLTKEKFGKEYAERKDLLAKELAKYQLEPHQVPEVLCKYLMGIEPVAFDARAINIVANLLKDTESRLEQIKTIPKESKNYNKKIEQKKQRTQHLRAGDNALFLAKDMLFLQPPLKDENGNPLPDGKANPDEFKLLQARIALFNVEKDNLHRTFALCGLTNSKNEHPFLHKIKIDKCRDYLAFYEAYLNERKSFLQELLKQENFNDYYFLIKHDEAKSKSYFLAHAKAISEKPVNLPRGLFKDALVDLLRKNGNDAMKALVKKKDVKHNTIFLLNKYFEQNDDGYQPFYDYKRNYRTVDEWKDKRTKDEKRQPIQNHYLSVQELTKLAETIKKSNKIKHRDNETQEQAHKAPLFYKVYSAKVIENEKVIRHYRTADQMLFLMCKEMLGTIEDKVGGKINKDLLLKNISEQNEISILETRIDFSIPFKVKTATGGDKIKTITDNFKIKDYGKLRKYLKDKRIDSLLAYFSIDDIPLQDIEKQLKDYERSRINVFEAIYDFENAFKNNGQFDEFIKDELKQEDSMNHFTLLDKYRGGFSVDKDCFELLNHVRNKFSHNQFPDYEKIKPILKGNKPFIIQIADYIINEYKKLTEQLSKKTLAYD